MKITGTGTCLAVIIAFILDFFITIGVIKLITMCFGLTFTWSIAIGIYLILGLLKGLFACSK